MSHYCALCKTELGSGARACGVCGTKVDDAVLAGANAPSAATAEPLKKQPPRSEPGGKGNDAFLVTPLAASALPAKGRRQGLLWKIGGCLSAVMLLGVAGWGVYTLWMLGPGGAIGASYHNSAGNAAFQQGDFTGADVHYSEMIALRPRQVDGYLLRAISAYRAGRYPQAIRDNTSALALTDSPMTRGGLYFNRAEAYSNRREWLKAVADYTAAEQAYTRAGNSPTEYAQDKARLPDWMAGMRRGRARANLQLKEYTRTIADYKTNVANGNFLPEDYGICATAEAALGQNKEAVVDYGHAIRIDPGYLYGYQGLDRVIGQTHQVDQAVAAYRLATQAHPDNVLCWGTLGWYEYAAGHIPEAISTDLRALSLDASQGWINYNLGLSYAVSGDSGGQGTRMRPHWQTTSKRIG